MHLRWQHAQSFEEGRAHMNIFHVSDMNIYITIKFKFSAEIFLIDDCASCVGSKTCTMWQMKLAHLISIRARDEQLHKTLKTVAITIEYPFQSAVNRESSSLSQLNEHALRTALDMIRWVLEVPLQRKKYHNGRASPWAKGRKESEASWFLIKWNLLLYSTI